MPPVIGNTTTTGEQPAAPLTGAELIRGVQAGGNVKMTAQAIAALGYDSPTSATGDLIVHSEGSDQRLPIGANGAQLVPDSTQPLGVKWYDAVGGLASQFAAPAGASLSGFEQVGTGAVPGTVQSELRAIFSVKQFGAVGDGSTDDTAAIAAAYAAAKTSGLYYCLVFPSGRYLTTSQFSFTDCYFGTFRMEGAVFIGGSTGTSYDSVFKVINWENFKIVGGWSVTADSHFTGPTRNPNLYASGAYFTTGGGGSFGAIGAYGDFYGLTTHHCLNGLRVGEYTNDAQIAETTFHGLRTPFCGSGAIVAGSQAVINFVGCIIGCVTTTDSSPALAPTVTQALQVEGSRVIITGGEINYFQTTSGSPASININPASSATYGNPYGAVVIYGANLESVVALARIANPRALSTPLSNLSSFCLTDASGYMGALGTAGVAVITIDDASYAGVVSVPDGNLLYFNAGTRTIAQINASSAPNVQIICGKTAFSKASGFLDWLNGVSGGQLIHAQELGFYAYANSGTQAIGMGAIVWNQLGNTGAYQRYGAMLNASTGVITVSTNAPRSLEIAASVQVGTPNNTGNIYVYDITNSRQVSFGVISGGLGMVSATIPNPTAGQQFAVYLNIPAAITWGGSVTNNLAVYVNN